jgi:hypothetical protein
MDSDTRVRANTAATARRLAAAKIRLCNADDGHTLALEVGQNGFVHDQIAGQTI